MTELGNTTLEDLGILTGHNGLVRALTDTEGPGLWLARIDGRPEWLTHSGCAGWGVRSLENLSRESTQWRRKLVEKREPSPSEAALVSALRGGKELREFTDAGHVASYQVRDVLCSKGHNGTWRESRSTLDNACARWFSPDSDIGKTRRWEIVDKPSASPVDAPGTVISWQEAQRRVDAGLAVETPLREGCPSIGWATLDHPDFHSSITGKPSAPRDSRDWTYRIPLQPAEATKEAEPVTMTADDALTNCQLKDCLSEARQCAAGRLARCIQLVRERGGLERQLASALASQKSAEAALGVERKRVAFLRGELYALSARCSSISDVARTAKEQAANACNETAGKESG